MKNEIEPALRPLVGLPLSALHRSRRVQGWQRFEFGPQQVSDLSINDSATCGQYIIHAVCGWRIVGPQGITIGAFDYSVTNDGQQNGPEFSESNNSIRDHRGIELLKHLQQTDLLIQKITADDIGSVHFSMTYGYSLDLLPIDSLPDVQWRFWGRNEDFDDFVVTGEGIERTKE